MKRNRFKKKVTRLVLAGTIIGIGGFSQQVGAESSIETNTFFINNQTPLLSLTNKSQHSGTLLQANALTTETNIGVIGVIKDVFPDALFAQKIADELGKNTQDTIAKEEAEKIKYIGFKGEDSSPVDLSGIEYLTNLENLVMFETKLKTIDLSKNKKLNSLQLDHTNLTKLDVSNLPELRRVAASTKPNLWEEVNVKGATKLESLRISSGKIKTIDVSTNPELYWLDISGNRITEIDISKNPKLGTLYVSKNLLTEIDISNNFLLTTINVSNNKIGTIDVSHLPHLVRLGATNSDLKEIDLSKNPKLKELSISKNQLEKLDLRNNVDLYFAHLNHNNLKELNIQGLNTLKGLTIDNNKNLKTLDVSKNTNLTNLVVNWEY